MLRAIILDFNGTILDDEPLHFRSMQEIATSLGVSITKEEYWNRYLPFDDERCLDAICEDHGIQLTESERWQALRDKSRLYREMLQERYPLFPGASHFVRAAALRYPLAIASGARRDDIEKTLRVTGLHDCFRVVVAAEDFSLGKPHPESFLLTLERLNAQLDGALPPIGPRECLVIEDSVGGVQGARAAGMICVAVSNTYPQEQLVHANLVVASLRDLDVKSLEKLFEEPS